MNNRILHKLLNSTGNAKSNFFIADPDYKPQQQTPEWLDVQSRFYLHLPEEETPIFIYKALSILNAFPGLLAELGDDNITYDLWNYIPEENFNYLVKFLDLGQIKGKLKSKWDVFPLDFQYKLFLTDHDTIEINTTNRNITVPVKNKNSEYGITYVTADWGSQIPIEGQLMFLGEWRTNIFVEFDYYPSCLDADAWLGYITSSSSYMRVLQAANAIDKFYMCDVAIEKLAVLLYALVKSHKDE